MTNSATTIRSRTHGVQLIPHRLSAVLAILLLLTQWPGTSIAEEATPKPVTPTAAKPGEPPRPTGPIQYVGPDTYILLDAQGRPQPVPGMTYEDFLAAWKKLNQAATPDGQPRFTIENIKIEGQTHGQRAELKLDIAIHLLAKGSVDIPLGLVGAILQGEPQFAKSNASGQQAAKDDPSSQEKPADKYVDFDPQRGGYIARTSGAVGERQVLSLNLIVPLLRDGAETTLALNCPRSTSSSLALTVDTPFTEARATSGAVTSNKSTTDGGTRIEVAGPSGQFRLSWQAASNEKASVTSVLNAVGAIRVTIDGHGVRSDARLTVRSFGGAFDQFRVRLPHGAKLIRDPATAGNQGPKYRITEEPQSPGPAKTADTLGPLVLVELKEKQQGPVVVDLSTEQPGHDKSQSVEVAGFEVLGAVRQYGDIALNVANDWQARWKIGRDVRQVDPNELDNSLQRSDLTAAFQYDRQPWSLGVLVSPRHSRIHVTPQYDLELLPEEARLNMRLSYQNFGARVFQFLIEIDGWELSGDPVESGGLVDQDQISVSPEGTLTLPLAQASSRKAEVTISLRHTLDRDAPTIHLPLPGPLADSVATGELTVRAPAETELLPDLPHSTGLAVSPAREIANALNPDAAAEFHFRSLLPNPVFAATRTKRGRDESAKTQAQIEIATDSVHVEEQIDYVVRYESVKELIFDAPIDISVEEDGAELELLGATNGDSAGNEQRTPLRVETISDENDSDATGTRRLRVALPQPRIGKFTVVVRYQIPRSQIASTFSALQVPLLSPVDTHITSQRAIVRVSKGVFVSPGANADSSSWKALEPQRKADATRLGYEFVTDRSEPTLPLIVSAVDSNSPSTTVVDRVWLQSWLSGGFEQDRAAFRLRTSNLQTTVELPPDAPLGEVEVLVDGQPAEVSSRAAGRIVVRLSKESQNAPDAAEPTTHTLEVRFRRAIQQALVTRHRVTPPQIDATTELSQIYWQIILPADEHIVQSPDQLVAGSQWQWLGAFWGRRPMLSQGDLEKWVGASAQIAPTTSDNQYLFTSLLPVSSIALVIAPRWLIVLSASALALLLLAGWFYLPVRIKPLMLVAVIVVIAAAAIAYPTAALLIAQASAIGMVLAPLSVLVSKLMARPPRRSLTTPSIAPSSQRVLPPRSDSIVLPPVVAAASTAPTVTLRTSDSDR